MKVKSILKILLAAVLVLSMCFGIACQGTDASKDTTTSVSVTEPEPEPEPEPEEDDGWVSAVFGGGPFVTGGRTVAALMKQSGFNTMIIWSVHVHDDGTLWLNDIKVCDNGKVVASDATLSAWKSLKEGKSGIKRVEISVGAWGCADFEGIRNFINRDGDGEDTVLYKNFKALIDATGADAVNFDDESCYDVLSATKFGKMCDKMGVKVALCPYTNMSFWKTLKNNLGDIVDRVYVQCYEGGAYNNPSDWARELNMKVIPGYYCGTGGNRDTASSVANKLKGSLKDITGGFMWLYDEMQNMKSPNTTKDYAAAINNVNPNKKDD